MEKVDCLGFKRFIEERLGLVVDHFDSDNLVTIDFFGRVKRKEDWNFVLDAVIEVFMEDIDLALRPETMAAMLLDKFLFYDLYSLSNELSLFLLRGMRRRNFIFALEYMTNGG